MGLDQYIYRTTKKRWNAHLDFDKLCKKYYSSVKKLEDRTGLQEFLNSLPRDEKFTLDKKRFSREQSRKISWYKRTFRSIAKDLGLKLDKNLAPKFESGKYGVTDKRDPVEEVMYWRKEWGLHNYIVANFWKDKENDNLVEIPLRRKDIRKMISDRMFPETFEELLKGLDKDHVLYYWPWY